MHVCYFEDARVNYRCLIKFILLVHTSTIWRQQNVRSALEISSAKQSYMHKNKSVAHKQIQIKVNRTHGKASGESDVCIRGREREIKS